MRACLWFFVGSLLTFGAGAAAETRHFQSPSGNIRCVMVAEPGQFARCDLGVDVQSYGNAPEACETGWGTSFGVTTSGRGFLNCPSDALTAADRPVVLPYGDAIDLPNITCLSETTGMTCINDDGGGFSVRRAEQRIF